MNLAIRKCLNSDIDELIELSVRVTTTYTRSFLGTEVDCFINSGGCRDEIVNNKDTLLVLVDGVKLMGFANWYNNELQSLMVDSPYHGTGAASFFMSEMVREKLSDYPTLVLECFEMNKRANSFYQKQGWKLTNTKVDDMNLKRNVYQYKQR